MAFIIIMKGVISIFNGRRHTLLAQYSISIDTHKPASQKPLGTRQKYIHMLLQ